MTKKKHIKNPIRWRHRSGCPCLYEGQLASCKQVNFVFKKIVVLKSQVLLETRRSIG
jgi:hypothetical protein